jgi:hypothetical protein
LGVNSRSPGVSQGCQLALEQQTLFDLIGRREGASVAAFAKQSIVAAKKEWIASSLTLLAMTTLKTLDDQARSSDCFIAQRNQPPDPAPFSPIIPHRGKQNRFD